MAGQAVCPSLSPAAAGSLWVGRSRGAQRDPFSGTATAYATSSSSMGREKPPRSGASFLLSPSREKKSPFQYYYGSLTSSDAGAGLRVPEVVEDDDAAAVFVVRTSEESCFRVCVRFLEASARARVSSFGL